MTVVKECTTLEQAWLAKNQLENEGIAADILDEATASTAPYLLNSSGIRLAVADEDAAAARQVLGVPPVEETRRERRNAVPGWLVFTIVAAAVGSLFVAGLNHRSSGPRGSKVDQDRRHDGKIDERVELDAKGQVTARYLDQNSDGKWDAKEAYENGVVTLTEQDLDFDGSYDSVSQWKNGRAVSTTIKPGGSGFPLFRYDYDRNGILETKWEDLDRNGAWDTCIRYDAMGRETGRQALQAK
ncbi:hypothetical protein [Luteolibacter sp. LG18]|uniref:hypothetical protein n=1 Tax=Luteolibacter sp. LG18 TaxID=2819286 RepID=UPI002B2F2BC3|nr:hypothetical protein llg_12860 [Luteolibacter sp. LG18]